MNLQTVKARATPLDRRNGQQLWRVTHPHTDIVIEAYCPVTAAAYLLRKYVLPRQVELIKDSPCAS